MQWDFVVLIWAQTDGSPWSPGNDLFGLNDDSVSATESAEQRERMFRLFHFYFGDVSLISAALSLTWIASIFLFQTPTQI